MLDGVCLCPAILNRVVCEMPSAPAAFLSGEPRSGGCGAPKQERCVASCVLRPGSKRTRGKGKILVWICETVDVASAELKKHLQLGWNSWKITSPESKGTIRDVFLRFDMMDLFGEHKTCWFKMINLKTWF